METGEPEFLDAAEIKERFKGRLRILLVSDIHLAMDKLKLLLKWHQGTGLKRYDFVLASGDFGNLNHNAEIDPLDESKTEGEILRVLQQLENFIAPIYYIPGNHDPKSFFNEPGNRPILGSAQNIHNQWIEVSKDLALMAVGGSCPSYFQKEGEVARESIYFPFPWSSDDTYKETLHSVFKQVTSKQIILMTHDGPAQSSTAQDKTNKFNEGVIHFGSPSQRELIRSNLDRFVCNVHGHCHEGSPLDKIKDVRIVNPGSLSHGEFGELELFQDPASALWSVSSMTKHYL